MADDATKPNTVTPEHIEGLLANSEVTTVKMGAKTTVVCVVLPNGFEVIESSGCVDPNNYDHELGVGICLERIKNNLWMLEGYALQLRLNEQ
jgi:hypothetical protein